MANGASHHRHAPHGFEAVASVVRKGLCALTGSALYDAKLVPLGIRPAESRAQSAKQRRFGTKDLSACTLPVGFPQALSSVSPHVRPKGRGYRVAHQDTSVRVGSRK